MEYMLERQFLRWRLFFEVKMALKQEKLLMGFSQDTKEHLNEIKDWALKAGRFEKDFNLDDFVDTTLLENGGFM